MGLGKTLTSLVLAEMYAEEMEMEMCWVMGKPWENHGKMMGKWENGKMIGQLKEHDRKHDRKMIGT